MKRWFICFIAFWFLGLSSAHAVHKEKNIIKFGRSLAIEEGRTVRGAATVVGDITVNGTVEDDVVAVGGSVTIGPKAVIGGNVVSIGGEIDKNNKSEISGNIVEANIPGFSSFSKSVTTPNWRRIYWIFRIIAFVGFLALALSAVLIIPKPITMVLSRIENTPVDVISWSLRGLLLIVPLAVILTMSVAGILLIPLEIILVAGMTLLGYIAASQFIGKKLREFLKQDRDEHMLWETFLGIMLLGILGLIPVLGWIVKAVVALIGFGGVLSAIFGFKIKKSNPLAKLFPSSSEEM